MLMLTGYFDESGHADDSRCDFVGMAGFVAPLAAWETLETEWAALLRKEQLSEPFHMKEFAHFRGQFEAWKERDEKEIDRRRLLAALVDLIVNTKATPIAAIISLEDFNALTAGQKADLYGSPYYIAFQQCTRGAAIEATDEPPSEKVAVVYSYNNDYGTAGGLAEQIWHRIKNETDLGRRLGAYASSTPAELCALQAADLFAYEVCHEFENQRKRPELKMRWALKRILKMHPIPLMQIALFDREELLRRIGEGTMSEDDAIRKTRVARMQWALERGEWEPPL
jgi:hypothetical protein